VTPSVAFSHEFPLVLRYTASSHVSEDKARCCSLHTVMRQHLFACCRVAACICMPRRVLLLSFSRGKFLASARIHAFRAKFHRLVVFLDIHYSCVPVVKKTHHSYLVQILARIYSAEKHQNRFLAQSDGQGGCRPNFKRLHQQC
jgi:hypothetical protein